MRAGSAPTLLAATWLAVGAVAAADEPPVVTDARDLRDTQRAESRWQAAGAASVPEALRAACGGESEALAAAGERRLRAVGLPAVVPVVEREARSAGQTSCPGSVLAVEILCQTKVADDRALEAVVRAVARLDARRPPDSRVVTLAGALTFAKRMQQTCAKQAVLARAAVAAVAARARAAGPGKERSALAGLLAAAGPAAAPLVPTLASWLRDDAESVGPAARARWRTWGRARSPPWARCARRSRRWRRHASGAVGPISADFPREDTLVPLVEALGAIGPGARAAGPELAELLSEESAHFAEGHRGELVIALVRALPRLAPPPASAIGDVGRLLVQRGGAGWHLADSRPSTVGIIGGPDVTWAELVDATGELGPAARPIVPQITPLDARIRSATPRLRSAAAAATLGKIGEALPEPAEALRRILVGRGAWLDGFQRRLYDGAGWKDRLHMPLLVAEAVNRCRVDVGDGPGVGADGFVGLQEGKNGEFAPPAWRRALCWGPGRDVAAAAAVATHLLRLCLRREAARRPAICPPAPPLVAASGGGAVSVDRGAQAVPPTTALPISDPERPHIDKPGLEFRGAWGAPQMSHPGGAIAARFRADGTLVSVGPDGSARLWDVAGRRLRAVTSAIWRDMRYGTTAIISADGRWLAIWRDQGAVSVAPVDGGPVFEIPGARDVRAVAFGPGVVACLGRFGGTRQLRIFDLAGRRVRAGVQADDAEAVALSSDGRSVVLAGSGWARAWAAGLDDFPRWSRTDLPADRLDCKNDRGVTSCPPSAAFLPDGRLLLGSGAELHLVDAATGHTVTRLVELSTTGSSAVEGLTPAADGKSAISITWGQHSWLRFWDLVAGRETAIFHELRAPNLDPRSLGSVDRGRLVSRRRHVRRGRGRADRSSRRRQPSRAAAGRWPRSGGDRRGLHARRHEGPDGEPERRLGPPLGRGDAARALALARPALAHRDDAWWWTPPSWPARATRR